MAFIFSPARSGNSGDKGNCPSQWDMSEEIFVADWQDRGLETLLLDYFECLHKAIDWGEGQVSATSSLSENSTEPTVPERASISVTWKTFTSGSVDGLLSTPPIRAWLSKSTPQDVTAC